MFKWLKNLFKGWDHKCQCGGTFVLFDIESTPMTFIDYYKCDKCGGIVRKMSGNSYGA